MTFVIEQADKGNFYIVNETETVRGRIVYAVRVFESIGGFFGSPSREQFYADRAKAHRAYMRYVKKYSL